MNADLIQSYVNGTEGIFKSCKQDFKAANGRAPKGEEIAALAEDAAKSASAYYKLAISVVQKSKVSFTFSIEA